MTWQISQPHKFSLIISCLLLATVAGCKSPMYKTDAIDRTALAAVLPDKNLLTDAGGGERSLTPGPDWLQGIDPQTDLLFLGVKGEEGPQYGVLLELNFETDRLIYLPLPEGEGPLALLNDPQRRMNLQETVRSWPGKMADSYRELPLSQMTEYLVSPIPPPRHIYAAAANYPSHLFTDMSLPQQRELIRQLKQARPRLFQKYPPLVAPGQTAELLGYDFLPGPFTSIAAPEQVLVPTLQGAPRAVPGHLDYEVEVAALIGRDLTWDVVREMDDRELWQAVRGFLLMSDAKVRDPQAVGKIIRAFREEEVAEDSPYRVGDSALDGVLGIWDEQTCHWWSYAASWGRYAALGPFLVAGSDDGAFPPRLILSARSYSSSADRPMNAPERVPKDRLLLRQAALTSINDDHHDALVWGIPELIRSLLDPAGNAMAFAGQPVLQAGDLIALGTPGGTVVSAKPWWLLPVAEEVLFWKGPDDFYDMFFESTAGYYLHPGDELFLWGEGMGYQRLRVAVPEDLGTQ